MGDALYLFRVMGRGDHDTDGMAVVLHAPKSSQDADTKYDRVKAITTVMLMYLVIWFASKGGNAYSVLKPAVPY